MKKPSEKCQTLFSHIADLETNEICFFKLRKRNVWTRNFVMDIFFHNEYEKEEKPETYKDTLKSSCNIFATWNVGISQLF
jgi:hypothetical protein